MITLSVSNGTIIGSYGNENFSIKYDPEVYEELEELQEEVEECESMEELQDLYESVRQIVKPSSSSVVLSKTEHLTEIDGQYYLKYGHMVIEIPMPRYLVNSIKEAIDKDLTIEPYIKFWIRLLRNPSIDFRDIEKSIQFIESVCAYISQTFVDPKLFDYHVNEMGLSADKARILSTVRQTPLTMEGLICTKKVVDEKSISFDSEIDYIRHSLGYESVYSESKTFKPVVMGDRGDSFYCGSILGHEIKVGEPIYLDSWDKVDCNPERECVKGLHTGNQDYIDTWEREDNYTLNVFVCPSQIGVVPSSSWMKYGSERGVMRVKSYFPHSIKDREEANKNLYHSSTYAKKLDEEWQEEKRKIYKKLSSEYHEDHKNLILAFSKNTDRLILDELFYK